MDLCVCIYMLDQGSLEHIIIYTHTAVYILHYATLICFIYILHTEIITKMTMMHPKEVMLQGRLCIIPLYQCPLSVYSFQY